MSAIKVANLHRIGTIKQSLEDSSTTNFEKTSVKGDDGYDKSK